MKIKRLIIHNIASYEHADISFDAEPLSSADVFLITGNTGSGKSTILDAICMALFGKTPRIDEADTSNVINKHEDMTLTDPRRLLRRNTGEGYVQLYFEASGIEFLAHWGVRRARNKPTGALQARDWWLQEVVSGNRLIHENKIKARIDELVGLDYDQFCRTTMLSQGEFDKFLKSKENEKAEILQKIMRDDTYQRIGQKIFAVTSEHKSQYVKLKEKLDNAHVLSDEEIAQLKQQIADLNVEVEGINTKIAAHATTRTWLETRNKLGKNVADITEALNVAIAETETDHYRAANTDIKQFNSTTEARIALRQISEQRAAIANANLAKETLRKKYAALLADVAALNARVVDAQNKLNSANAALEAESDRKPIYDAAGEICTSLRSALDSKQKAKSKRKEVKELGQSAAETKLKLAKVEKTRTEQLQIIGSLQKSLDEQQAIVDAVNIGELREHKDSQQQMLGNIDNAVSVLKLHDNNQKAYDKLAAELADAEKKQQSLAESLTAANQAVATKKAVLDKAEELRDKQRAAAGESAAILRRGLNPGDECPVCGQRISDVLPVAEVLEKLLATADEAYHHANDEYMQANAEVQRFQAEIKTNDSAIAKAQEQLPALKQTAEQSLADVMQACNVCNQKFVGVDKTIGELVVLKVTVGNVFAKLKESIEDYEKLQAGLDKQRAGIESAKKSDEEELEQIADIKVKLAKMEGEVKNAETLAAEFDAAATEARNSALSLLGAMVAWDNDPITASSKFIKELTDKKNAYNALSESIPALDGNLQRYTMQADAAQKAVSRVGAAVVEWGDIEATTPLNVDDVAEALNAVAADVKSAADSIVAANEKIETAQTQLDEFISNHQEIDADRLAYLAKLTDDKVQDMRGKIKELDDKVLSQRGALQQAEQLQAEHQFNTPEAIYEAPETTIEQINEVVGELEKNREVLAQRSGAITQQLSANTDEMKKLQTDKEACDKAETVYNRWKSLNDMFGDSEGKKFRTIALSYVLNSLIRSANVYMSRLTDRYRLSVQPGTFIILVEDAYQGYTTRTSNTISGGETFLVSLALALALSDLGSMRGIDVLFIDEGFGSLSGEPLQKAIETLRILHSSDRRVGIISHVAELRERIPVQIQVTSSDRTAASTLSIVG